MGVERAVTRWYLHRHMLLRRIEQLQALLDAPAESAESSEVAVIPESSSDPTSLPPAVQLAPAEQLREAQRLLHALGPCPKPVMS